MEVGDQIIYIPDHATGITHRDAELGFVTKDNGKTCFCRFWRGITIDELRTTANSESVHKKNLEYAPYTFQKTFKLINKTLKELGYDR